jgi:hypothetical protein
VALRVIVPNVLPKYDMIPDRNGTGCVYVTVTGRREMHTPPTAVGVATPGVIVHLSGSEMERIALSMVGQPEAELLKSLGQPRHVVPAATLDGRPVDYPWQGMNFVPIPTLTVHNKVLLYSKLDMAIYVYVNEQDVVEYVVTAGT